MMKSKVTREEALELLKTYNKEPFHIQHGLTVEKVMRWYARELDTAMRKNTGGSQDSFTILILNCTRSSTARRRRNFSEKEEWGRT